MLRKFIFSIDEFYHIYNRGVDKRVIFLDHSDYSRFTKLLWVCNHSQAFVFRDLIKDIPSKNIFDFSADQTLVDIGAYCLMPNHFHLLLHEKVDNGISVFMHKVLTSYSKYFNAKYKRTGNLFEGVFRATHLDNDVYLQYIYSYINLNPVKLIFPKWKEESGQENFNSAKTKKFVEGYKYSSYQDHQGIKRQESKIINKEAFPDYFEDKRDLKEMLNFWLNYQDESIG
ncbi:MAG: hypothetical protein A2607_00535 [Candidatus Vogelbacteria bacterium RIFOXYD1_FULL_42_15]|uniref:Transposase IS200-like domain-containing protein n=1 Tax=Candidatus Vogelbacteria bacterium RIFOXYD1_FULL_42_15 TaxID=1802437 RepID=A0A1G2QGV4_9BACT|nr:MAG: hypothetical protein A2607_00535 [Candidatus Vogelbacteria bacterium RIFOXYD1_FULL_42_15]